METGLYRRGVRMDDYEAIRQLKAQYFRFLDTKDWDRYGALFTEDVLVDVTGSGGGVFNGRDAYMAYTREHLTTLKTVHQGHMAEITITSPTVATGIWAMEDRLEFPDGTQMDGQGHYFETYQKLVGRWQIREMFLTRLRMRMGDKITWHSSSMERSRGR
jgi:uncharacterized protein (TIGR02246 family)